MRIISDFKDYYDGVSAHDEDRTTMFVRNRSELDVKDDDLCWINGRQYHGDLSARFLVGFAGTLYPGKARWQEKTFALTLIYDPKLLMSPPCSYSEWLDIQSGDTPEKWYSCPDRGRRLFDKYGPQFMALTHSNLPNAPPIPSLDRDHIIVVKNPCLSDLGFAKVVDPYTAYNQLQTFLWNQTRPERPIPEMSNETKIHQAGFNERSSFRAEPGTSGPRRKRK